jgi:16S rRNA (guanine(966)-N(2))-methyltransferase RsmD
MRVIAGRYGGRRFHPPDNIPTRPTTDFAKTGLFNILNNEFDFPEISCLDLFAGTGNLSFEMASRGSNDVVCVDQNQKCVAFIEKTAKEWNIEGLRAVRADAFAYVERCQRQFDIVLADPPYQMNGVDTLPDKVLSKPLLTETGWLVLETNPKLSFEHHPNFFHVRKYGTTHFHFFKLARSA